MNKLETQMANLGLCTYTPVCLLACIALVDFSRDRISRPMCMPKSTICIDSNDRMAND